MVGSPGFNGSRGQAHAFSEPVDGVLRVDPDYCAVVGTPPWSGACIERALSEANFNSAFDTVAIEPGNYTGCSHAAGARVTRSHLLIASASKVSPAPQGTLPDVVWSCDGVANVRPLSLVGAHNVTVSGLAFRDSEGPLLDGGLVSVIDSSGIAFVGCTFSDGKAGSGGAMLVRGSAVVIRDASFRGNTAVGSGGGVGGGGSIAAADGALVAVVDSVFEDGRALVGAALHSVASSISLTRCTLSGMTASVEGGVAWVQGREITLVNTTMTGTSFVCGGKGVWGAVGDGIDLDLEQTACLCFFFFFFFFSLLPANATSGHLLSPLFVLLS